MGVDNNEPQCILEADSQPKVPHLAIIGAGFGGITVCQNLLDEIENNRVKITIIDHRTTFMIKACLQFVLNNRKTLEDITQDLNDAIISPKIRRCYGYWVTKIDVENKSLRMVMDDQEETLNFDYLVIATGVVSDPTSIPGLKESMLDFCNPENTHAIRDAIEGLPENGTVCICTTSVPYKCPPAPFEYAFLIDDMLRKRGIRDTCKIIMTTPKGPFPFGGPDAKKVFLSAVESKGIEFRAGIKPNKICPKDKKVFFETTDTEEPENSELEYDVLVGTYPQRAPDVVLDTGMCNAKGFVPVDLITMETKKECVFCIGDSNWMMLPGNKPHPKSGAFAMVAGENAAAMLKGLLAGEDEETARSNVSKRRVARCYAETSDDQAIMFEPKLFDDEDGPSGFLAHGPLPEHSMSKVDWIGGIQRQFFGETNFVCP
mmetsp:Transcript_12325/g.23943  ORF Transcript_12325/g.23943 Transcript_12325/m.23943 type:complete len:431 (-) Transcript_12325:349-1641(-)